MRLFFIILLLIIPLPAFAQWQQGSVGGMQYEVLLPAGYSSSQSYPAVLFLHQLDMGDDPNDLLPEFTPALQAMQAQHPSIVVMPLLNQTADTSGQTINFGGVTGSTQGEQRAVAALKQVMSQYSVNPAKVYVTGASMGAQGTVQMLMDYGPNSKTPIFAAGLAMAAADPASTPQQAAATLGNTPLIAVSGSNDTTNPPAFIQGLAATDPSVSLTMIQGAGHDVWDGAAGYGNMALWNQLFSNTLGSASASTLQMSPQATSAAGSVAASSLTGAGVAAADPTAPAPSQAPASSAGSTAASTPSTQAVCTSIPAVQTLLPCGPLHVVRSQTVSQAGQPVRLNCTAWWGDLPNWPQQMLTIVTAGFNCLRISYFNRTLAADLQMIDQTAAVAKAVGIRIIVNDHANEGGGNCAAQQANGLWYDSGGASGGTDGCGGGGGTTDAQWVQDWTTVAQHYAGNDTVIGYDLWNEPTGYGVGSCWGCGDPSHDILAAYQRAGNAILAVDPTKLIIAEGVQDYSTGAPEGDLRPVATKPLVLAVPGQVVYSVHEYPNTIGGPGKPDQGAAYITQMNGVWGYLITQDVAPVWVGEMGASMNCADESAWASTITAYVNGTAPGGLVIPAGGQGVGTDWWMWSTMAGGLPDGALESDAATPRPEQAAVYTLLVQAALAVGGNTSAYSAAVGAVAAQAFPASELALPQPTTGTASPSAPAAPAASAVHVSLPSVAPAPAQAASPLGADTAAMPSLPAGTTPDQAYVAGFTDAINIIAAAQQKAAAAAAARQQ